MWPRNHANQEVIHDETAAEKEGMVHDDDDTPSATGDEDTSPRSFLRFDARKLRREGKIGDTWVFDVRIKIKTLYNCVVNITKRQDLADFSLIYSINLAKNTQ